MNKNVQRLTAQQGKALSLRWKPLPDMPEEAWQGRPALKEWWTQVQEVQKENLTETRKWGEQILSSLP